MSGSAGFTVSINAKDQTTGTLDSLNKRLAKLSAPAERFNKSLSKFSDVSGLSRVSEGIRGLGSSASDAFRSLDRMASPLAAITSVGSLAGMAELTRRWMDLGSQIGRTSFRLAMPVEKLSAFEGAGRRFGATASQVDQSISGLRNSLYGAVYRGENRSFWAGMGIDPGTPGHVLNTGKAMDQLADKIAATKDVHTKLSMLIGSGQDPSMLPLYNLGAPGMHKELQRQADLGGTVTKKMTDDAIKAQQAYEDLSTSIRGVANRLGDDLGNKLSPYLEMTAKWIGANRDVADSYTKIGAGISVVGGLLLGLGKMFGWKFITKLAGGTALSLPLALSGDTGPAVPGQAPGGSFFGNNGAVSHWWGGHAPSWAGGSGSAPRRAITVPRGPTAAAATMQHVHDYFRGKGLTEEQTAGILSNAGAESSFDPSKWGDKNTQGEYTSYGLFQTHATRLAAMQKQYGTQTPNTDQQLDFAWKELNTSKRSTLDAMRLNPHDASKNGSIFAGGFEVPSGGYAEYDRRGGASGQFMQYVQPLPVPPVPPAAFGRPTPDVAESPYLKPGDQVPGYLSTNGHVHVEVTLRGATAGTTVRTKTSGPVTASPARVDTPMAMGY